LGCKRRHQNELLRATTNNTTNNLGVACGTNPTFDQVNISPPYVMSSEPLLNMIFNSVVDAAMDFVYGRASSAKGKMKPEE
jgi:hypothetical protein